MLSALVLAFHIIHHYIITVVVAIVDVVVVVITTIATVVGDTYHLCAIRRISLTES